MHKKWKKQKKEERRQRDLEEKRAMAGGGITINTPAQAQATAPTEDPMEKLTKLKAMLDNGILTQAEFEAKKADILSKM